MDERKVAARFALAMYAGESCVECKHVYESVDDLIVRDVVFAGYHGLSRCCCGVCWNAHLDKMCSICESIRTGQARG